MFDFLIVTQIILGAQCTNACILKGTVDSEAVVSTGWVSAHSLQLHPFSATPPSVAPVPCLLAAPAPIAVAPTC